MNWDRYEKFRVRGRRDDVPGPQFFETVMGHRHYEGTMPRIAKALERIAAALEAQAPQAPRTTAVQLLAALSETPEWKDDRAFRDRVNELYVSATGQRPLDNKEQETDAQQKQNDHDGQPASEQSADGTAPAPDRETVR